MWRHLSGGSRLFRRSLCCRRHTGVIHPLLLHEESFHGCGARSHLRRPVISTATASGPPAGAGAPVAAVTAVLLPVTAVIATAAPAAGSFVALPVPVGVIRPLVLLVTCTSCPLAAASVRRCQRGRRRRRHLLDQVESHFGLCRCGRWGGQDHWPILTLRGIFKGTAA
jgi:hypothetical protein